MVNTWLKENKDNLHYCKHFDAQISKAQCKQNKKRFEQPLKHDDDALDEIAMTFFCVNICTGLDHYAKKNKAL